MDISAIYVHDGTLLRVTEDPANSRVTMDVELPALERNEQLKPRLLVFDDVYGYEVHEGCINGCPTLLDLSVVGQEGRWTRIRLDTTVGHREILCAAVRVEPGASPNGGPATRPSDSEVSDGPPSVS
ncbi:MAG TPA: hypothetical protein VLT36_25030 [Candidatus Dormibacteraeota bacterium]|nr:hypothetical protein [Candidatus Dormibacteraeota bacterium]